VSIENFTKLITVTVREVLPRTVAYALYLLAIVHYWEYWRNNIVTFLYGPADTAQTLHGAMQC